MTLANKFYVELSFTVEPHNVSFGTAEGEDGISVFKDEGGIGVVVPIETEQVGIALNMAIIKARKHLSTGKLPWKVVLIDAGLMEDHYTRVNVPAVPAPTA